MNTQQNTGIPDETPDEGRNDPTIYIERVDTQQFQVLGDNAERQTMSEQIPGQVSGQVSGQPAGHLPEQVPGQPGPTPFKVEPVTPVPDDVVSGDAGAEGMKAALPNLDTPATPPPSAPVPTSALPTSAPPSQPHGSGLVTVRRGPLPMTIMLGLLSIIVAGYVLATNILGADFDMKVAGPTMFGALGGLLLIVGLVGVLAGGRGRRND